MIELTLAEITEALHGDLVSLDGTDSGSLRVSGPVVTDSREAVPGSIFFAKPGDETDGHLFAPNAVESGAVVVIVDHALSLPVPTPQIIVADTVVALGDLARYVVARVRSRGRLTVVGITGSNGKTTTKNLVRSILDQVGETIASRASYNNEVGAPLTMLEITDSTQYLVAEMGASHRGDIARLIDLARPNIGVVLKVGLAHAGEFGSIEDTLAAKTEMVSDLLPTDTAVLNRDDFRVASMAEKTVAHVLWFGRDPRADVRAEDIQVSSQGTAFTLVLPQRPGELEPRRARVEFRVLGEHHVMNALAAAAVADALGMECETIVSGLCSVHRAERWRMEIVGGKDGVTVINDAYNASPDSMAAALKTLAQIVTPPGRSIAVLGEMSELGDLSGEEHDRIGLLAVRLGVSQLVVVGQGARRMHISAIKEGSWDGESVFCETPDEAFDYVQAFVREGDTVLVKSSNSAGLRFLGDRLGEAHS